MKRALIIALVGALVLPAGAWAHAALLRTSPSPSVVLNAPPTHVALTYSEAVEPRFAIVSVTDASGRRQTAGSPTRSAGDPNVLEVPLQRQLGEGWYLVFWRVISEDGHPVRGAFTFAIGPNPGPAPAFEIPSLSETAVTAPLIVLRWLVFLSTLAAIGLLVLRVSIARPLLTERPRALACAFWVATVVALVVTPLYVLEATAQFSLRSFWDIGALVPLMRRSAFGRGYLRFEALLALFAVAGGIAIWLDRGAQRVRSVAELVSLAGAAGAAAAVLFLPGVAGHAAQTDPRALSLALDWLHLASAALWMGGLLGLLVLWRSVPAIRRTAALVVCVPRFSNVAFVSVAVLLGTGVIASIVHLPTLGTLWSTSYGKMILVKAGLLLAALVLAAGNVLRVRPSLLQASPPPSAAILLRRLVGGETLLVAGAVAAAAVLSSLPPPPKAMAGMARPTAALGPGPVSETISRGSYDFGVRISPNRAAVPNDFAVQITKDGTPVRGADVTLRFTMLDMAMQSLEYRLAERSPGLYEHSAPALVMVGRWGLTITLTPARGAPVSVVIVDRAGG
ncbi:MAG TPA: copper resistance protein CopC [Gaiellaceae bacterium]